MQIVCAVSQSVCAIVQAVAVVMPPIAIALGASVGIDSRPLVVAVMVAASASFATPIGYQTNLLVMGPGHYKVGDYLKAGTPLVIIIWLAFTGYLALRDAVGWM